MARFTAYYNLCPIHDTKEFLGLSKDCEEGNIITTLGRNIIMVIKLSNQKQIRSWTVSDKLSSKVVYDTKSQQYVGVFGNRYIRCWNPDTLDINKLKKIKFHKNIIDLVCTEKDGVILLYDDGTCESLSCGLDSRKEKTNTSSANDNQLQNVINTNVLIHLDERRLLCYFVKNDKTDNMELVTQILDEETLKPSGQSNVYSLNRENQNVSLTGYTVMEGSNSPCLLTIWSDKRVFIMPLTDETAPDDAPGNFISMLNNLNTDNPLSLVGISKHCVAIYGANSNQEGSSLIVYNTQFRVIKTKQFFKIYFDFSRLWTVSNHILLAMGQNLSVVSFRMSKEMLCEMIGSQIANETNDYVGDNFINEEDELEEIMSFNPNVKKTIAKTENYFDIDINATNITNQPTADGKEIPFKNYYDFEDQLNELCENTQHLELLTNESSNDIEINFLGNVNGRKFLSDEIEIIAKELEKLGASEQEITEKLINVLIKADRSDDIAICLRRYTNISEKMLAKVLNYALLEMKSKEFLMKSEVKNEQLNNLDDYMDVEVEMIQEEFPCKDILIEQLTCTRIANKSDLLNVVLSCSINVDTIGYYIRKEVDFKCCMTLLKHLYRLITSQKICLEERAETSVEFDDDEKILQWFGIILNTHFQDMVLSKDLDVVEVLMKWEEVLLSYRDDLKELGELAAILYNVVDKKLLAQDKKYSKWYSIEEVKLY